MHGLAKIKATAQPFGLPEPPVDPRLSIELDKYAYESQDEDQTDLTNHSGAELTNRTHRVTKRKRKSLLESNWGAKKRRLSRSSSTFLSTERDPLTVQEEVTTTEASKCSETVSVVEDGEEEEKSVSVDRDVKLVTPKKADQSGAHAVTLTSWFKKLTPPSSAERQRQAHRTVSKTTTNVAAMNPITNYYQSRATRPQVKPAKDSDIKLLSKCLVQVQNIFPHGIGRASVNKKMS